MPALLVEFVDELPPGGITKAADIAVFAAELRKQPGRWAKYPWSDRLKHHTRKQRSYDINGGRVGAPRALREGFEAAVRDDVMYVRYHPQRAGMSAPTLDDVVADMRAKLAEQGPA